jgi:hypothetical protein
LDEKRGPPYSESPGSSTSSASCEIASCWPCMRSKNISQVSRCGPTGCVADGSATPIARPSRLDWRERRVRRPRATSWRGASRFTGSFSPGLRLGSICLYLKDERRVPKSTLGPVCACSCFGRTTLVPDAKALVSLMARYLAGDVAGGRGVEPSGPRVHGPRRATRAHQGISRPGGSAGSRRAVGVGAGAHGASPSPPL